MGKYLQIIKIIKCFLAKSGQAKESLKTTYNKIVLKWYERFLKKILLEK